MEELLNKMHVLIDKFRLNYDDNGDINKRIDVVVEYLFKYYKGEKLLILSFCDSDGISYLHPYIQRDFLGAIRSFFLEFRMHMNLINGCNVMVHQPKYIDSLLSHNVRISDIKRINKDSYISKMEMMNLPDWVVSLGNVYKLRERIRKDDYNLGIRDVLRDNYEPFIIYNCGYSDLIAGENLDLVMDKIQKNIEHFLSINSKSDIVILGSNIHKGDFKEIISQYNDSLKNLCNQYNISYIDPFILIMVISNYIIFLL